MIKDLCLFFFVIEGMEMKTKSDNTSPINNSTSTIDNPNDGLDNGRNPCFRTQSSRTVLTEIVS